MERLVIGQGRTDYTTFLSHLPNGGLRAASHIKAYNTGKLLGNISKGKHSTPSNNLGTLESSFPVWTQPPCQFYGWIFPPQRRTPDVRWTNTMWCCNNSCGVAKASRMWTAIHHVPFQPHSWKCVLLLMWNKLVMWQGEKLITPVKTAHVEWVPVPPSFSFAWPNFTDSKYIPTYLNNSCYKYLEYAPHKSICAQWCFAL